MAPESAYKVAQVLRLDESERTYFTLLVELARAGDRDYLRYVKGRLDELKRNHEVAQKAPMTPTIGSEDYFVRYLSSWIWVAIHLATAIPQLRSAEKIADRLSLPLEQVKTILVELESLGLIRREQGGYQFVKGAVHISNNSPWVLFHHMNWRQKAIQDSQRNDANSLHFTNILTLDAFDRQKIRDIFLAAIEKSMSIAGPSPAEDLVCLTVDFFSL